jgi:lysylphosphatidylglycerol synthetase-like protein (DUF2156 family)
MKKLTMLLAGAEIALIATAVLYLAFHEFWITFVGVASVAVALALVGRLALTRSRTAGGRTVGVGTVCAVGNDEGASAAGERQIFVEVVAVSGETFVGKLARCDGDPDVSMLRPGLVVLVAFDPAAREELSLPDDVLAVHASWLTAV